MKLANWIIETASRNQSVSGMSTLEILDLARLNLEIQKERLMGKKDWPSRAILTNIDSNLDAIENIMLPVLPGDVG